MTVDRKIINDLDFQGAQKVKNAVDGVDPQDYATVAQLGSGGAPSGPAGGVLDGSYPDPGLAAGVAGAGLAEASDVLSVNVDASTIEINADTLRVKADGITANEIAAGAVGASELASTAVTPTTYGDATHVGQFTVDADGRITSASAVAITGAGGGTGYLGYISLQDQKTANTDSGTFTSGSWQTRVLNTEVVDTNSDCTLSSNQFTLTAGTYEIVASAPASFVDQHKVRLRNVTDSSTILVGSSEYSSGSVIGASSRSFVVGRFTIAAAKALELQHRCATTKTTNGFGTKSSFDEVEVFAMVELRRVS